MIHQISRRGIFSMPQPSVLVLALHLGLSLCAPAVAAPLDISQIPPGLGQTLPPNILYIHDDSGSMTWAYMPDNNSNQRTKRYSSSTWNRMYFNPSADYPAPLDHNGNSLGNARFAAAWENGYLSNRDSFTRNLATQFAVPTVISGTNFGTHGDAQAAFYHEFLPPQADCAGGDAGSITDDDCYVKQTVSDGQKQNFANWYSYYRSREMTAKAGISRAFAQLGDGARIGYGLINDNTLTTIDGKRVTAVKRGVREFTGANRKAFFDWLFGIQSSGNTPLRRALDAAGQYYENDNEIGPWSTTPGASGGNLLACRKSFTILMTDGYWNGDEAATAAARANNDGDKGNPFADDYSNTLADVAMYYWKRDLFPTLANKVPPTARNPATWQHMATYTIGLGVEGRISKTDAFAAINDPTAATITWPNASSNQIDDLLHAAVNGRGDYFSASDPGEFAAAMRDALSSIADQTAAISPLGQSSSAATVDTFLYQAKFNTEDWSGWLTSTAFDPVTGALRPTSAWTSSVPAVRNILTYNTTANAGRSFQWANLSDTQKTQLDADAAKSEKVLNWVRGDQSEEQPSGALRKRDASALIGDIVNSKPLFVGSRNEGYGLKGGIPAAQREAYMDRLSTEAFKRRQQMVYVGANDGMLHGFNSGTYIGEVDGRPKFSNGDGVETFAYVPATVYGNLSALASPDYNHRYFVDGSPSAGDAYIGGAWKTVLVGSTGAGGRSYFALDVEAPGSMTAEKVMWEFTHAELGLSIGQATIARTNRGEWVAIFGNGYNSTSQKAQLFIVNLSNGSLLRKIDTGVGDVTNPNGLATPVVVDINLDGNADLVYAGDYQGNLWKFDLTDTDTTDTARTKWKLAFNGKPLFKAVDSTDKSQPITARPAVRRHPDSGLVIYFGTGKSLLVGDQGDLSEQALYGVFDLCGRRNTGDCWTTTTASRVQKSELREQDIYEEGNANFGNEDTPVNHDYRLVTQEALGDKKGFFITLLPPSGTAEGERVTGPAIVSFSDRVIFTTEIPNDDPCSNGATGWLMEVDPFSGGRTDFSVFDMNADGYFNTSDQKGGAEGTVVSGRRTPGGATPAVLHGAEKSYKVGTQPGEDQSIANRPDPNLVNRQAWQQIR